MAHNDPRPGGASEPEPRTGTMYGNKGDLRERRIGRGAGPDLDRRQKERATSGRPLSCIYWSGREDLNLRPPAPEVRFAPFHSAPATLCVPGWDVPVRSSLKLRCGRWQDVGRCNSVSAKFRMEHHGECI